MTNKKSTKRALLMSALALLMCVSMLIGSTFAWFTDSVTSAGNIIQSGTLDVDLVDADGNSMEGKVIEFKTADGRAQSEILWDPGCTYETNPVFVVNKGNLALKYQIVINGLNGDAKLLEAIEWTVTIDGVESDLSKFEGTLIPGETEMSGAIVLSGHMKEDAGNEYQDLTIEGISISVFATQFTYEEDSFNDQYDALATYMNKNADGEWEIANLGQLIYFAKSVNEGNGYEGETVVLTSDIDLAGINWTPIGNADADTFVGFKGTFDGKNFTISNLKINSTSWGKGLFGYMDDKTDATVKNLKVNNANVTASDCAGIIVGYATKGTFENIHITGDVSVVGTVADGYVGGIAGCGYNANFNNCSVVANAGSEITSAGSFAGGIVGYQCNNKKAITDCKVANLTITGYAAVGGISGLIQTGADYAFTNNTVEDVVLNKTRVDGNPSIGALVGSYSGTAATTLTGSVTNVTLNGTHVAYSAYNNIYGSNYSGATTPNFDVSGVTVNGITDNLGEVVIAKNADALATAIADGKSVVLGDNIALDSSIKIAKGNTVVLDLNGKTITGADAATGSFGLFTNNGNFTVKDNAGDGKITLKAANDRDWNAYSSVISNNPGGKFVLESGTIEHLGGTDMAYGIDNLTNGKGTYAETVVNGGTVVSPYRAIRMFLNGVEAQNILTVNGGTIKGDNKSIWMQDPSKNANTGTLTVNEGASLIGDVNLTVTAGSTSWPVTVSINEKALKNDAEVLNSNVPEGYEVKLVDGCYVVAAN